MCRSRALAELKNQISSANPADVAELRKKEAKLMKLSPQHVLRFKDAYTKHNKDLDAALDAITTTTTTEENSMSSQDKMRGTPMIHSQIVRELGGNTKAALAYQTWLRARCIWNLNVTPDPTNTYIRIYG